MSNLKFNEPDIRKRLRQRRPSDSNFSLEPDKAQQRAEGRTPWQRDLDRLLYNYYTRRLARITQVSTVAKRLSPNEGNTHLVTHNRLTHSLKVGQVARRTAHYLFDNKNGANNSGIDAAGGIDFDVAEFAGRAHDIGHPPFGHAGEQKLAELALGWGLEGGFEGNAQTFRILTQLTVKATKESYLRGLDLTYASLASVVKYPWSFDEAKKKKDSNKWNGYDTDNQHVKFGYYDIDTPSFVTCVQPMLYLPNLGTLEAQIMDWADDVSYAVHDLEDFAFQGKIPVHSPALFDSFWIEAQKRLEKDPGYTTTDLTNIQNTFEKIFRKHFKQPLDQSEDSYIRMSRCISEIITKANENMSVTHDGRLKITSLARGLITVVKHLTVYHVIEQPDMYAQQAGDKRILGAVTIELHRIATAAQEAGNLGRGKILPKPLCESVENAIQQYKETNIKPLCNLDDSEKIKRGIARGVIDYVASLTEDDVFNLYRLYGLSAQ